MSVSHKPPLHPDRKPDQVEAYELPRWDSQGRAIKPATPAKPKTTEEDVAAEDVQLPTAEELRKLHEDAYNEGFESGYEQGMKQGQQDGQQQGYQTGYQLGEQEGRASGEAAGLESAKAREEHRIEQALQPLVLLLQALQGCLTEQRDALEQGMVALSIRIARQVIDAELALQPDHINTLVHAAVQALPNADERLTIELNPEDVAYVERVAESHWSLVANADLSRGGCLVKTRFSYVDYSLEHRFRQQVSNLLAHYGLTDRLQEFEQDWPLPPAQPASEHNETVITEPEEAHTDSQQGETTLTPELAAVAEPTEPQTLPDEVTATDHPPEAQAEHTQQSSADVSQPDIETDDVKTENPLDTPGGTNPKDGKPEQESDHENPG